MKHYSLLLDGINILTQMKVIDKLSMKNYCDLFEKLPLLLENRYEV